MVKRILGSQNFGFDCFAERYQFCIRAFAAEGADVGDARLLRTRDETGGIGAIGRDDRGAAVFDAFEDFGFGIGDGFTRAEEFQMGRRNGGDDRDMGANDADQRADFAEMIHAHFEDRRTGLARQRGDAERHAPMVVVGRSRGMGLAERAESMAQDFLGRGFAGAAGDGDDLCFAAGARGAGKVFQPALGVGDFERDAFAFRRETSAALAPRSKAAATKSWPSRLSPFSATKRSPG